MKGANQELRQRMETFAVRTGAIVDFCDNEEQTKVSLINPYLEMLGYDVRDPRHVRLEVRADIHTGNEKVDYAILREGEPWMVVEAKKASAPLGDSAPTKQIRRYAMAADVQYVAYTNGRYWRWFRKNAGSPMLEEQPFLEHDVIEPEDREIRWLAGIHNSAWNADDIARIADEESLQSSFSAWYEEARDNPPEAFLKLLLNTYGHRANAPMLERAAAAWKATLRAMESAQLNEASRRLRGGMRDEDQGEPIQTDAAPTEDEARDSKPESDGPRRRWHFRWRAGPDLPWRYERSGKQAQIAVASALFEGKDESGYDDILGQLNSPLAGDDLRKETARRLEPGTAVPRYFESVGNSPRVAVYTTLSLRRRLLWFARARNAVPTVEVETDRGLRDPNTNEEHWPWEAVTESAS